MTTLRHIFDVNAARIVPTRESRKSVRFPALSPAAREELLSSFHPDYKAGAYREIRVGANKGGRTVRELADLLESDSPLDPGMSLVPDHTTDLLVIGGGGAGCTAALIAHRLGIRAMIATKLRLGDSNTVMAEGGVQAAVGEDDSPVEHFKDAVRGGHYKNDRGLLRVLVEDGPEAMLWLCEQGVLFDREPDGRLRVKPGGEPPGRACLRARTTRASTSCGRSRRAWFIPGSRSSSTLRPWNSSRTGRGTARARS